MDRLWSVGSEGVSLIIKKLLLNKRGRSRQSLIRFSRSFIRAEQWAEQ